MKTYVIMVSTKYPAYHPKKGQRTYFPEKILAGFPEFKNTTGQHFENLRSTYEFSLDAYNSCEPKLHTIRANFPLWEKRMQEVQEGKAVISLRYHTLGRYVKGNKHIEFARLDRDSGCGVQKIEFDDYLYSCLINDKRIGGNDMSKIMRNDGLSNQDFEEWFIPYDLSEPMAIIQFGKFRY